MAMHSRGDTDTPDRWRRQRRETAKNSEKQRCRSLFFAVIRLARLSENEVFSKP
jgi:hypothetical protein